VELSFKEAFASDHSSNFSYDLLKDNLVEDLLEATVFHYTKVSTSFLVKNSIPDYVMLVDNILKVETKHWYY
jgi:hypothetical protein